MLTCAAMLLHHNAPAHMSLTATEFVTNNMVVVPHPPYSPDLAPCDFAVSQIENETEGPTF
jgi:histone-lysine N-methyltransferase SETMAR